MQGSRVKRIIKSTVSVLLLVVLCALLFRSAQHVITANASQSTEIAKSEPICEVEGDADSEAAIAVDDELSALPSWMLEQFQADGWSILVTNANLTERFQFTTLDITYGVTDPGSNTIYIASDIDNAHNVTAHEMGHWLDHFYDYPSTTIEFERAIAADNTLATCVIIDPFTSTRQELFAECFEAFVKRSNEMKMIAPHLYSFVEQYAMPNSTGGE